MAREKTGFRHQTKDGDVLRVTKEAGKFYIGNTDQRAEGQMKSANDLAWHRQTGVPLDSKPSPEPGNEWSDYAHTSEDI